MYRVTLQTVHCVGSDPTPHCIRVSVVPSINATGAPAPLPATVPVVTVPADLYPVLPTHVCPAHRLSNFCVSVFQLDAREVMKGLFLERKLSQALSIPYVPAAHGAQAPLTVS